MWHCRGAVVALLAAATCVHRMSPHVMPRSIKGSTSPHPLQEMLPYQRLVWHVPACVCTRNGATPSLT